MMEAADFKPVPTRASLLLQQRQQQPQKEFQALVFQEPQFNSSSNSKESHFGDDKARRKEADGRDSSAADPQEFDIKRARHEVIRFATQNQRVLKNKKKMQIMHAIQLGAKPPRKHYKNYKVLLEERKRLKQIRDERQKFHQLGKNQTGAAAVKCSNQKKKKSAEAAKKKRAPVADINRSYGVVMKSNQQARAKSKRKH